MRFWIDTEFNDYKGALISMALVGDDGRDWYEVLDCQSPSGWVAQNVMPKLGKQPITLAMMQESLRVFLAGYSVAVIVADWPEDLQHFCETLIVGPGLRINTPYLYFECRRDLESTSETSTLPHNALEDARALRLSEKRLSKTAASGNGPKREDQMIKKSGAGPKTSGRAGGTP